MIDNPPESQESVSRHSRLGIVSVAMSVIIPVVWISVIVAAILIGTQSRSIGNYFGIGGLIFAILAPALHFLGAILGISGFFSKETKNIYPVVGTVLNLLLGISGVLIIILIATNLRFGFH